MLDSQRRTRARGGVPLTLRLEARLWWLGIGLFLAGAFVAVGAFNGATYDLGSGSVAYFTLVPASFDPFGVSLKASIRANETVIVVLEERVTGERIEAEGPRAAVSTEAQAGETWIVSAVAPQSAKGSVSVTLFSPIYLAAGVPVLVAGAVLLVVLRMRGAGGGSPGMGGSG